MLQKAVEKAVGDRARCVMQILAQAKIADIDQLSELIKRTGAVAICGLNTNVLIEKIDQAYAELSAEPVPDGLDEIGFPEELLRHLPVLRANGIHSAADILLAGIDGLVAFDKIGKKTAASILEVVGDNIGDGYVPE